MDITSNKKVRINIELDLEEAKNLLADLNKHHREFVSEDSHIFYDELNDEVNSLDED